MKIQYALLLGVATLLFTGRLEAQGTGDSIVQITADAQGLSLVSPDQLPPIGTYWMISPGGGPNGCVQAPLPIPPSGGLPVYEVTDGQYIVDGTVGETVGETVLEAQANAIVNLINQIQGTQGMQAMGMGAMDAPELPLPGGGDDGGGGYYPTNSYIFSINTNLLWLQITNVTSDTAYANLFNGTDQVYAIWATPDLLIPFSLWTVGAELFPTNSTTNCLPFTVPTLGQPDLFLKAEDWTGVYANGLPCWWTWYNFHTLDLAWEDQDANGNTLGYDYTNHIDPNVIAFTIAMTNTDVNTTTPDLPLNIITGVPGFVAVLVNNTNFADASWQPYTGPDAVPLLGADGNYTVTVGLRGFPTNDTAIWQQVNLTKNTIAPRLTISSPVQGTVSQPVVQIQGYAMETLNSMTFDLSNANGALSNQPVFLTGQYYNSTLMAFTTNYFQSDDIDLTGGTNIITLHATDWFGNQTNLSLTLYSPAGTQAPVVSVISPTPGTTLGGETFTVQAQVDNPAVSLSATIGSTTIQGIVQGNGSAWVQGLPVVPGTNTVTITASDANGHVTVTNLTVTVNDLGLGVLPYWDANQLLTGVVGTIDSPDVDLVVNGVPADNDGDGYWYADDVPVSASGLVVLNVQVYSNSVIVASQTFDLPQPPILALTSYSAQQDVINSAPLPYGAGLYEYSAAINWYYQTGGTSETSYDDDLALGAATNGAGFLLDPPWNTVEYDLPCEFASISVLLTNYWATYQSQTRSRVMVMHGGMAQPGTTNLYLVMARACEFSSTNIQLAGAGYAEPDFLYAFGSVANNINASLPYGGDVGLPPKWLQINGQTLIDTGITNTESGPDGPSTISEWGATLVAAPADKNWDVTATATNVYQNLDYTFAELETNVTLQIWDTNAGVNFTGQTNTVIVGQQMNLTCQLSIAGGFMTNFVLTNIQWTIPGFAISNYVVAADSSSAIVVTNFATNSATTSFYWVDGASNRTVQCSVTINGVMVTAQATFNILRSQIYLYTPLVPGTLVTNGNLLYAFPQGGFAAGIHSAVNGQVGATQLLNGYATNAIPNFGLNTSNSWELDGEVFYSITNVNPTGLIPVIAGADGSPTNNFAIIGDDPEITCSDSTALHWDFKDYIRFQSDNTNSIYVTLGIVNWHIYATAALSNAVYILTSVPDGGADASFTDTTELPQWTKIANGSH